MQRRTFLTALAAPVLLPASLRRPGRGAPAPRTAGLCLDAYRATATAADFAAIRALGATDVALFVYARMERPDHPSLERWAGPDDDPSLRDAGLLRQARLARDAGLGVTLFPMISDPVQGVWRGAIRMPDEEAWAAWFAAYERYVLSAAALAHRMDASGLCVGAELGSTVGRAEAWEAIIRKVRDRFGGWLTYAANWNDYDRVPWWALVDRAGIQAYFPLGNPGTGLGADATAALEAAWAPVVRHLASFASRIDRPVLFTEIGYKSARGATVEPWHWTSDGPADPALQAAAYEAAFRALWGRPWFAGMYWWKWHPASAVVADRARAFTPQGKPAEAVLAHWYGGS